MRKSKSGGMLTLLVVAILLLGACCSDDDDAGSGGGEVATSLSVVGTEFAFSPDSWTIAADTDVPVTFTNEGLVDHEWVVVKLGSEISSETEFSESDIEVAIRDLRAGDTDTITINLPAAEYQIICVLEGHYDAGMEGSLTVSG